MCFLIAIGTVLFLKNYILDIRLVSGHSMEPTLSDGHNRYLCRWRVPQAGDIVLYHIDGRDVIKRCVQTEGTTLHFALNPPEHPNSYAALTVKSRTIPLTRVQFRNIGGFLPADEQTIPAGFILAIGDNVSLSLDSLDYVFVASDSICGSVLLN